MSFELAEPYWKMCLSATMKWQTFSGAIKSCLFEGTVRQLHNGWSGGHLMLSDKLSTGFPDGKAALGHIV